MLQPTHHLRPPSLRRAFSSLPPSPARRGPLAAGLLAVGVAGVVYFASETRQVYADSEVPRITPIADVQPRRINAKAGPVPTKGKDELSTFVWGSNVYVRFLFRWQSIDRAS